MSEFTPGPWDVIYGDIYDSQGVLLKITTENARLIAAAPELLHALELILGADCYGYGPDMQAAVVAAQAAIAKARGKNGK